MNRFLDLQFLSVAYISNKWRYECIAFVRVILGQSYSKAFVVTIDVYETSGSFVGNPAPSVEETDRLEN